MYIKICQRGTVNPIVTFIALNNRIVIQTQWKLFVLIWIRFCYYRFFFNVIEMNLCMCTCLYHQWTTPLPPPLLIIPRANFFVESSQPLKSTFIILNN